MIEMIHSTYNTTDTQDSYIGFVFLLSGFHFTYNYYDFKLVDSSLQVPLSLFFVSPQY